MAVGGRVFRHHRQRLDQIVEPKIVTWLKIETWDHWHCDEFNKPAIVIIFSFKCFYFSKFQFIFNFTIAHGAHGAKSSLDCAPTLVHRFRASIIVRSIVLNFPKFQFDEQCTVCTVPLRVCANFGKTNQRQNGWILHLLQVTLNIAPGFSESIFRFRACVPISTKTRVIHDSVCHHAIQYDTVQYNSIDWFNNILQNHT